MRRLGTVAAHGCVLVALPVALSRCEQGDKKPPTVTRERSQAVVASPGSESAPSGVAGAAAVAAEPVAAAEPKTAPARAPRKLCGGKLNAAGHPLPKTAISRASAAGERELAATLPVHDGLWTWVNFWAAWCVPCKEEIPRLKAWEQKLNQAGRSFQVVFVSLDDDSRQLRDFLNAQPRSGLRATYWLTEGREREAWLKGAGLTTDPGLPVHVLVDPKGRVRCTIEGAVEDRDFDQLSQLMTP